VPRTAVSEGHAKLVRRELRATREALGLTQAELARRMEVSPPYVAAVEAGGRNLTLGQLANIANAMRLGVDVRFVRPDGTAVRDARGGTLPVAAASAKSRRGSRTPDLLFKGYRHQVSTGKMGWKGGQKCR
jgi:transcriptional regulator with XRE-family HTH domain